MSSAPGIYIEPHTNRVGIGTTLPADNIHIYGNATVTGTITGGTGLMYRNRIINGDMRLDQRNAGSGVGGLTGVYLTSNIYPSSFPTLDRWTISSPNVGNLVAEQVSLSSNDKVATGGAFSSAIEIGLVPKDGLAAYFPFNSNLTDASGNGVTLTPTGTMAYAPSVLGNASLYLSNETNVNTATNASRYVSNTTYIFTSSFTVSLWINPTIISSRANMCFITHSGIVTGTSLTNTIFIAPTVQSTINRFSVGFYSGNAVYSSDVITTNTWYHATISYTNGNLIGYLNGKSIGTCTGTVLESGFKLGDSGSTTFPQAFAGFIDDFRIYNRVLSPTEIAALATSVGTPQAPLTTLASGLTTWLTFDNTTADAQGTLSAPTPTGTTTYSTISKVGTYCLDLTANTAGGTAINALTYTLGSGAYAYPFTIVCWFNANTVYTLGSLINIGNVSAVSSLSAQIFINTNGNLSFKVWIGSTAYSITSLNNVLNAGTWYHAVLTANSSSYLNAYLNGIIIGSLALPAGSLGLNSGSGTINTLRIGADVGTTLPAAYKGYVDDVRIYNRALSSEEVAGLYASSQYASYSLLQQTIEGQNLYDLGWGTTSAQPLTASMWVKNNSSSVQQLPISVNNASSLAAWMDFEGSSFADKMGLFTNTSNLGNPAFSTSIYKIGTASLDLTANTVGTSATVAVKYNVSTSLLTNMVPITFSLWAYPTVANVNYCLIGSFGNVLNGWTLQLALNSSTQAYALVALNGTGYQYGQNASTVIPLNAWSHLCCTVIVGVGISLYINGNLIGTTTIPSTAVGILSQTANSSTTELWLGRDHTNNVNPYKGYIDDVRIYNTALSPAQISQLYRNNATTTTSSNYLLPRSIVYTTPAIPANSWQKVSVTIPGDTTGNWLTTPDPGLTLSLCLGASSIYNTNNLLTWESTPEYTANSTQIYGSSSNNLLANVANSIYVTGVQLEKGTSATSFEFRNYNNEHLLANLNGGIGNVGIGTTLPRATLHVNGGLLGIPPYVHIEDQKANNIAGGTSATGWQTRTLNTIVADTIGIGSLSANTFILPSGTYEVFASAPAYVSGRHRIRLYNVTNSVAILIGTSEYSGNGGAYAQTRSFINSRMTLSSSTQLRIDHYIGVALATNGLGVETNSGDIEIYTSVKIIKIA